jgi:propionate catabolism operon transcriptional regulator
MPPRDNRFKLALVGSTNELAEAVRHGLDPAIEDVTIRVVAIGQAAQVAQRLFDDGVEVIFGHMGTSRLMQQATGRPIVHIPRSRLELLVAFQKAREFGRDIGLTSYERPTDGVDVIEELLGVRVRQLIFNSVLELKQAVHAAWDQGVRVIVGGGISQTVITRLGGKCIVPVPRPAVVARAFESARMIAANLRRQRKHEERTNTILQMVDDGVVGVDRRGRVDICNDRARKILGIGPSERLDRAAADLTHTIGLDRVLADGRPQRNVVQKVRDTNLLIHAMPIVIDDQPEGAVAFLKEVSQIESNNRRVKESLYKRGLVARYRFDDIRGASPRMQALKQKAATYAATGATILIQGATGTGKELLAHAIHNHGSRARQPFVAINCAALPEQLLESELFGYEEGAFTGARRGGKLGLFELAHTGTVFLDEIGDISPDLQMRLLRVIEAKEVMRLGGDRYVPVDVRILSASHKDLRTEMESGTFRADLYFRLAFLRLTVPPLASRTEDIPLILADLLKTHGRTAAAFTQPMLAALEAYHWPGNVRELIALAESYLMLLGTRRCDKALFDGLLAEFVRNTSGAPTGSGSPTPPQADEEPPPAGDSREEAGHGATLKDRLAVHEAAIIQATLEACRYNRTATARRLGISVNTLWRKLQVGSPAGEGRG